MRVTSIYFIAFFASFTAYAWNYAKTQRPALRLSSLRMGRAAAVRANTKAKTDAAKSKNNGIYAKKIIMAIKAGGGPDPDSNRALQSVIADAKGANVPNDVIKRNIEKASAAAAADFTESTYEFYGAGNAGIVVNVVTDNTKRATNDVNLAAKKNLLKAASQGSVLFNFERKARIDVKGKVMDEDEVLELCLGADVDDFALHTEADGQSTSPQEEGDSTIFVNMDDMAALRDTLRDQEDMQVSTSLQFVPTAGVTAISDEAFGQNMDAIDALLDCDDVDSVHHNIDLVSTSD